MSAAGLLPFIMAPDLCKSLISTLETESSVADVESVGRAIKTAQSKLIRDLSKLPEFKRLSRASETVLKNAVVNCVRRTLGTAKAPTIERVHDISRSAEIQMRSWIDQALGGLGPSLPEKASQLESLYRELQSVEVERRKVPPDEVIAPIVGELNQCHVELGRLLAEQERFEKELASVETELSLLRSKFKKLSELITMGESNESRGELAGRIQAVLESYKSRLIERRLADLQRHTTECFNLLSRKKDNLRRIQIDPVSFAVTLLDRNGKAIAKEQLSAGEKQIYAISILWALARVSGRPLPMIIDTPLARLDGDHRILLAENYFPEASHQTLILSTDTEVDQHHFELLKPHIAYSYHLEFDQSMGSTKATRGYFWRTDESYKAKAQ